MEGVGRTVQKMRLSFFSHPTFEIIVALWPRDRRRAGSHRRPRSSAHHQEPFAAIDQEDAAVGVVAEAMAGGGRRGLRGVQDGVTPIRVTPLRSPNSDCCGLNAAGERFGRKR